VCVLARKIIFVLVFVHERPIVFFIVLVDENNIAGIREENNEHKRCTCMHVYAKNVFYDLLNFSRGQPAIARGAILKSHIPKGRLWVVVV